MYSVSEYRSKQEHLDISTKEKAQLFIFTYSENQKIVEQRLTQMWIRASALICQGISSHYGDYDTEDRDRGDKSGPRLSCLNTLLWKSLANLTSSTTAIVELL